MGSIAPKRFEITSFSSTCIPEASKRVDADEDVPERIAMKLIRVILPFLMVLMGATSAFAEPEVSPSERVQRNVVVRVEPSAASQPIGALSPGDSASVVGDAPGWHQVRLSDGRIGFVSKAWTIIRSGPEPLIDTGALKLHVIDVGTGLAVFVEGPSFTMLYDGGSQDDLADGPDNRILNYIQAVSPGLQTIDHLILSHPHKDHLELLPDIFDRFMIRNVWDSGAVNRTRGYCRFLKKVAAEPGVQYHNAIATGGTHRVVFTGKTCSGEVVLPQAAMMTASPVALGPGGTMSILYRDATKHHDPNENSVVIRLDYAGRRILIAGDAEGGARKAPSQSADANSVEGKLIACCSADLRSDVLVVGHHGSMTSSRREFLDKVQASTFIISSGPHPYSKVVLPDAAIEDELRARGALFQTDLADDDCAASEAKIGPDNDESPGGCDNVIVTVSSTGQVATGYFRAAD